MVSQFNSTSTPKGSYSAKTGDNDCNVNSSRYSLSTALCESIRFQAKSEQNVRQDLIPRVRHGEAAVVFQYLKRGEREHMESMQRMKLEAEKIKLEREKLRAREKKSAPSRARAHGEMSNYAGWDEN